MSTNVNYGYIGDSSNVNVDRISFSKDVQCLITKSPADFIDKNEFRRLKFRSFRNIIIKVENILQKSLNKMRCISSVDRTGGTFYKLKCQQM